MRLARSSGVNASDCATRPRCPRTRHGDDGQTPDRPLEVDGMTCPFGLGHLTLGPPRQDFDAATLMRLRAVDDFDTGTKVPALPRPVAGMLP